MSVFGGVKSDLLALICQEGDYHEYGSHTVVPPIQILNVLPIKDAIAFIKGLFTRPERSVELCSVEGTCAPPNRGDWNSNFSGNLTEKVPSKLLKGPDVKNCLVLIYT